MPGAVRSAKSGHAPLCLVHAVYSGDAEPMTFATAVAAVLLRCKEQGKDDVARATRQPDRNSPPRWCPQQPGMRNSSRSSCPHRNADNTASTGPHRCCLTRMPRGSNARCKASESAAHSSTSTRNCATLSASACAGNGLRMISRRSTSLPRRQVTTSNRIAVSSTGEMRPCKMGSATITLSSDAPGVPAANQGRSPCGEVRIFNAFQQHRLS